MKRPGSLRVYSLLNEEKENKQKNIKVIRSATKKKNYMAVATLKGGLILIIIFK